VEDERKMREKLEIKTELCLRGGWGWGIRGMEEIFMKMII
jgi:hypothetical protein